MRNNTQDRTIQGNYISKWSVFVTPNSRTDLGAVKEGR